MLIADSDKQFFDTFGIEPIGCKDNENCTGTLDCRTQCPNAEYPQITDRILLELICILNPFCYPSGQNIQHLKESVLDWCITFKDDIEQQVQALFGGSI